MGLIRPSPTSCRTRTRRSGPASESCVTRHRLGVSSPRRQPRRRSSCRCWVHFFVESAATIGSLTDVEARWITAIRRAAPTIPLLWAFYVARAYVLASSQDRQTDGLDRFLALELWSDGDRRRQMSEQGLVPRVEPQVFAVASFSQAPATWPAKLDRTHTRTHNRV